MTAHRHDKQRRELRRSSGPMKALDANNRPAIVTKRFHRTPLTIKPKGWGYA